MQKSFHLVFIAVVSTIDLVLLYQSDFICVTPLSSCRPAGSTLSNDDDMGPRDVDAVGSGQNSSHSHDTGAYPRGRGENDILKGNVVVAIFSSKPSMLYNDRRYPQTYRCTHTKRTITFVKALQNVSASFDADVVIFADDTNSTVWEHVQRTRNKYQIWVYATAESPYDSPQVRNDPLRAPLGFGTFRFNMSFTYHHKAEVHTAFGIYKPIPEKQFYQPKVRLKKMRRISKPNMVAWVTTNQCHNNVWNMSNFVHRLAKLVPVHMYGGCGNGTSLPRGTVGKYLMKTYKFHLALENSCCSEYITDQLWEPLSEHISVPIVVGPSRKDYDRVAPPNSFIFANDFESLTDLAAHIRKVASNMTLYNEYHKWRKYGEVKLFKSIRIYPFATEISACALLKYLERNAWNVGEPMQMALDPHGSEWLGSCYSCGEKDWFKSFDLCTDPYVCNSLGGKG